VLKIKSCVIKSCKIKSCVENKNAQWFAQLKSCVENKKSYIENDVAD
jgi:hypothetical protein